MNIAAILSCLESFAPLVYQETFDNCGLLTGNSGWECTGAMVTLDTTVAVVSEAIRRKCNLIVTHHPIIFGGLKKITGENYVEKAVIAAIKNDIAIYAIHTNLDNVIAGVNGKMAGLLGLTNTKVLNPAPTGLKKLFVFVPTAHLELVREAVFNAGAGHIGNYSEAGFITEGVGSFKAGKGAHPFVGEGAKRHYEEESRLETIFPAFLESSIVAAMIKAHPYEEVAYDIVELANTNSALGSGLIGDLPEEMDEKAFLTLLRETFKAPVIRHTSLRNRPVRKCALCGGAGSFLIPRALAGGADIFITADLKYHEFFDAGDQLLIADLGHFESEQYTIDLLYDILREKYPNFAVQKTTVNTNPVHYFFQA
jgi:dinuclear metal center YbgI/SA1388 family protein